jgi:hypothetical protein
MLPAYDLKNFDLGSKILKKLVEPLLFREIVLMLCIESLEKIKPLNQHLLPLSSILGSPQRLELSFHDHQ